MDEAKLLELFRRVVREELGGVTREEGLLTYAAAAKRLSVSVPTLRRMVKSGELLISTASKTPKVPLSEIRRLSTPSASMPTLGQRAPPRASLAKLKAASLSRQRPNSVEAEIAKLHALRAARKKKR